MKGGIENNDAMQRVRTRVVRSKEGVDVKTTQAVILLKGAITKNLNGVLGEKMKHFTVDIQPGSGTGVKVCVNVDDIGRFLYSGTSPHTIRSSTPMPMPDGGFAMSANHPGQKELKPEIDRAITAAVKEVKALIKTI